MILHPCPNSSKLNPRFLLNTLCYLNTLVFCLLNKSSDIKDLVGKLHTKISLIEKSESVTFQNPFLIIFYWVNDEKGYFHFSNSNFMFMSCRRLLCRKRGIINWHNHHSINCWWISRRLYENWQYANGLGKWNNRR